MCGPIRLLPSTSHVKWKHLLKMALCCLVWILLGLSLHIPCVGNIILGKLSLIHEENVRQNLQPFTKSYIWHRWHRQKPSWCKIPNTHVPGTAVVLWTLCILVLWLHTHCCQNITFSALSSFTFCIHWEKKPVSLRIMHMVSTVFQCRILQMWVTLPVYHNSSPIIFIAETVHVSILMLHLYNS
jgi:hypothetical protein